MKILSIVVLSLLLSSNASAVVQQGSPADSPMSGNSTNISETTPKPAELVTEKKLERVKTVADKELDRRIEDLGKVIARVSEFKNLAETDKSAILALINGLVGNLNSLKTEIENTSSTTIVNNAREIIGQNYRVYALVMPQLNTIAAADRMTTMVSMMNIVAAKIETRLGSIATSTDITTANLTSAQKSLADMKVKLADAQKFAQEAVSLVAPLVPDQGDKAVFDQNLAVLKDAKAKIKSAQASLVSAKKSAEAVLKIIGKDKNFGKKVGTSTPETN